MWEQYSFWFWERRGLRGFECVIVKVRWVERTSARGVRAERMGKQEGNNELDCGRPGEDKEELR